MSLDMADFSEENYKDFYEIFRPDIIQYVDPDRQFMFSYLRSKFVLDDEDCERITNGSVTRPEKVSKFLNILSCKGIGAQRHFVDALEFEYPILYEKITGKKAVPRVSPVPDYTSDEPWNWITGLAGKELIDFDRQFLANQLQRALNDLQSMAYNHKKILEEKNILERKLYETTAELELQQSYFHSMHEEIMHSYCKRRATETEAEALKTNQPLQLYLQELWQENMEKGNVIIALQGKLLAVNEEFEIMKRNSEQLEQKNQALKESVKELTINYDSERRNSKKLNETVKEQTDEIQKLDSLRKTVLELKYQVGLVQEERDNCRKELEEFRKWTEVLNARFDIVAQEREELRENSEDISGRYMSVQDRVELLESKLLQSDYRYEAGQREIERLRGVIATHKEQRKQLLIERETAINERNVAIKERDTAQRLNKELQSTRDSTVNDHMALCHELEEKYDDVVAQLQSTADKLKEKDFELEEVRSSLIRLERSTSVESSSSSSSATIEGQSDTNNKNPTSDIKRNEKHLNGSDAQLLPRPTSNAQSVQSAPCARRTNKELIDSIRRKIYDDSKSQTKKGTSLPSSVSHAVKGLLGYEQMHWIYPKAIHGTTSKMPITSSPKFTITSPTKTHLSTSYANYTVIPETSSLTPAMSKIDLSVKRPEQKKRLYVNVAEARAVQAASLLDSKLSPLSFSNPSPVYSDPSTNCTNKNDKMETKNKFSPNAHTPKFVVAGYPFINQNDESSEALSISNPLVSKPLIPKRQFAVKGKNRRPSGPPVETQSDSTFPMAAGHRDRANCMDTSEMSKHLRRRSMSAPAPSLTLDE